MDEQDKCEIPWNNFMWISSWNNFVKRVAVLEIIQHEIGLNWE